MEKWLKAGDNEFIWKIISFNNGPNNKWRVRKIEFDKLYIELELNFASFK